MHAKARRSIDRWAFVIFVGAIGCARERATIVPEKVASSSSTEIVAPPSNDPCTGWPSARPASFRVTLERGLMPLGGPDVNAVHEALDLRSPEGSCSDSTLPCKRLDAIEADRLYDRLRHEDLVTMRDAPRVIADPHIWHGRVEISFEATRCAIVDGWSMTGDDAKAFFRVQDGIVEAAPEPVAAPGSK